jgi:hypothetical protein
LFPRIKSKKHDCPCIPAIPGRHACNNRDPGPVRQNQVKQGLYGIVQLQILPQTGLSEFEIQAGIEVFRWLTTKSSLNSKEMIACE